MLIGRFLIIWFVIVATAFGAAGVELPKTAAIQPGLQRQGPIPLPPDLTIPRYYPGPAPFRSGETLVYEASWVGIPAAQARVVLLKSGADGAVWTGKLWLRSSTAVDLLYRMRDYVYEDFNRDDLRPHEMHILQREKQRHDEWTIHFDDSEHRVTSIRRNAHGRIWLREFSGGEPWGPFSGAMLALSLPLSVGETYTFDVFSGGNRYVLAFNVDRREMITTSLGTIPALRIIPSVVWLSEGKFRDQVSQSVLWISDDERHLPLRIEAAAFVGSIRVELTQVLNAPQTGTTPSAAQRIQAINQDPALSLVTPIAEFMR